MLEIKKLVVSLAVLAAVSVFPLAAYANPGHHDWERREHHERMWHEHEREWAEHDREWREHQNDVHWRKVHVKKWHDWYRWHEDNEREFHLRISDDEFVIDINR